MIRSTQLSKLGTIIQICQIIDELDESDQNCFMNSMQMAHAADTDENKASKVFFRLIISNANEEYIKKCQKRAFEIHQSNNSQKYKAFKPNNRLSSLPNNMTVNLGKFLTKSESIILGYIDRTLYIATQYKFFIVNRQPIIQPENSFW